MGWGATHFICSRGPQVSRAVAAGIRLSMEAIGHRCWAIAEGYIPGQSHGPEPEMESHEAACMLNAGEIAAEVTITVFFTDREPVGPYEVVVPARRTVHLRFNELNDPEPVPRD